MAKNKKKSEGVKPVGRPKIEIDWNEFEKLCHIQCTLEEIADWFKCSVDTIERRCKDEKKLNFAEYFKKNSVGGRISLRRDQFKTAHAGNPALLIFLGKQYLGQKDKQEINTGEVFKVDVNIEKELEKRGIPMPRIANEDVDD